MGHSQYTARFSLELGWGCLEGWSPNAPPPLDLLGDGDPEHYKPSAPRGEIYTHQAIGEADLLFHALMLQFTGDAGKLTRVTCGNFRAINGAIGAFVHLMGVGAQRQIQAGTEVVVALSSDAVPAALCHLTPSLQLGSHRNKQHLCTRAATSTLQGRRYSAATNCRDGAAVQTLQGRACSLSLTLQGRYYSLGPPLQGRYYSLSPTL